MQTSSCDSQAIVLNGEMVLSNPRVPQSVRSILKEAENRWLRNVEVYELLSNYNDYQLPVSNLTAEQPSRGQLYLFDRKGYRFFRKDGHQWSKTETHMKLKIKGQQLVNCYYAQSSDTDFQRRCYWILGDQQDNIVLVHYMSAKSSRRNKQKAQSQAPVQNLSSETSADIQSEEIMQAASFPESQDTEPQVTDPSRTYRKKTTIERVLSISCSELLDEMMVDDEEPQPQGLEQRHTDPNCRPMYMPTQGNQQNLFQSELAFSSQSAFCMRNLTPALPQFDDVNMASQADICPYNTGALNFPVITTGAMNRVRKVQQTELANCNIETCKRPRVGTNFGTCYVPRSDLCSSGCQLQMTCQQQQQQLQELTAQLRIQQCCAPNEFNMHSCIPHKHPMSGSRCMEKQDSWQYVNCACMQHQQPCVPFNGVEQTPQCMPQHRTGSNQPKLRFSTQSMGNACNMPNQTSMSLKMSSSVTNASCAPSAPASAPPAPPLHHNMPKSTPFAQHVYQQRNSKPAFENATELDTDMRKLNDDASLNLHEQSSLDELFRGLQGDNSMADMECDDNLIDSFNWLLDSTAPAA